MFWNAGGIIGSFFEKIKIEPNDIGRLQFYKNQTEGKFKLDQYGKSELDDYFFVLKYGKHQFDLLCREYQQMHKKGEWWGLYDIWIDWEGDRWLLPYLLKWHNDLPDWIDKEDLSDFMGL